MSIYCFIGTYTHITSDVSCYDQINRLWPIWLSYETIFFMKQHLNVHKRHAVLLVSFASCVLFWGEYMPRFVAWWILVEDCCLFKLVINVNEVKTDVVIDWKGRKHYILFTFSFKSLYSFTLFLVFHMWCACIKFCKDRVCTASLYDGLEYRNK